MHGVIGKQRIDCQRLIYVSTPFEKTEYLLLNFRFTFIFVRQLFILKRPKYRHKEEDCDFFRIFGLGKELVLSAVEHHCI